MKNDARIKRPAAAGLALGDASLWPSAEYDRQLDRLRDAVGQPVYSVEVTGSEIQMTVPLGNWPAVLLSVIDLLAADPVKRLYPHMVVLDDGRGLNLGWIARITTGQPFDPPSKSFSSRHACWKTCCSTNEGCPPSGLPKQSDASWPLCSAARRRP